jgi:phosphatidylinositol kinase/protein kinase (PI-3  family)
MESKKKPLWLNLIDADTGGEIKLMLKVGDDLRQDALIMQLLRVMSDLWKKEGLDMQMQLYDCISTGDERGLLQIVDNANTLGMRLDLVLPCFRRYAWNSSTPVACRRN